MLENPPALIHGNKPAFSHQLFLNQFETIISTVALARNSNLVDFLVTYRLLRTCRVFHNICCLIDPMSLPLLAMRASISLVLSKYIGYRCAILGLVPASSPEKPV